MSTVYLPQAGHSIRVPDDQTILDAALQAGAPYPHGCKSGRCGSCKSRLIGGIVDLLPHTPFTLSAEERAQGLILTCRALPRSDATVVWLGGEDEIADVITHPPCGGLVPPCGGAVWLIPYWDEPGRA